MVGKDDWDEAALFRHAMQNVKPIQDRDPVTDAGPGESPSKTPNAKPEPSKRAIIRPLPVQAVGETKGDNIAHSAGMDKRQATRLRRGETAIDARLDLHGLDQQAAHQRLVGFLISAHDRGLRCVLVITGKGNRGGDANAIMPERSRGVLKRNLPLWLNEPNLRGLVLSTATARPRHGGDGALYVLLRRRRDLTGSGKKALLDRRS